MAVPGSFSDETLSYESAVVSIFFVVLLTSSWRSVGGPRPCLSRAPPSRVVGVLAGPPTISLVEDLRTNSLSTGHAFPWGGGQLGFPDFAISYTDLPYTAHRLDLGRVWGHLLFGPLQWYCGP